MTKIVINKCYGGFGLSKEAMDEYCKQSGNNPGKWNKLFGYYTDFPTVRRDDPLLVSIVETMNEKSWGDCARLKVVEIPDDVEWEIKEYDGQEWVAEVHRAWY